MARKIEKWVCDICEKEYENQVDAKMCEVNHFPITITVEPYQVPDIIKVVLKGNGEETVAMYRLSATIGEDEIYESEVDYFRFNKD